jgi:hypothetical protein
VFTRVLFGMLRKGSIEDTREWGVTWCVVDSQNVCH